MAVVNATDQSFRDILLNDEKIVVKFYAGWCGSCKLIAPKFAKLSENEAFKDVTFVEVDAENNPQLRAMAKVNNLPFFASFKSKALVESFTSSKIDAVEEMTQNL